MKLVFEVGKPKPFFLYLFLFHFYYNLELMRDMEMVAYEAVEVMFK